MEASVFDSEIEKEFLRTLILNGSMIYEVKPKVSPEMLSSEPHYYIYKGIEALADRNAGISREILLSELNDKDILDKAGGRQYIDEVLNGRPNKKAVKEHIKRIQNNYKARKLYELNSKIPQWLEKPSEIDSTISRINKDLENLALSINGHNNTAAVGDLIDEVVEHIRERRETDALPGIPTGFDDVDFMTTGLMKGDVWYIAARPSMGKSAWLLKALLNMAKEGIPCMLFSQEMSQEQLNERILSILSGVPYHNIKLGDLSDKQMKVLEHFRDEIKELPLFIDSTFGANIDEITALIRKYHQLHDIQVVGLDYIQLIVERTGDATGELGRASRVLKLLSNELEISTIILSQLNREVEKRDNKRPLMADLRQSGNLEEDADILATLYRDEVYIENSPDVGKMEFIIRKARNGPIGTVMLNFNKETVNITSNSRLR